MIQHVRNYFFDHLNKLHIEAETTEDICSASFSYRFIMKRETAFGFIFCTCINMWFKFYLYCLMACILVRTWLGADLFDLLWCLQICHYNLYPQMQQESERKLKREERANISLYLFLSLYVSLSFSLSVCLSVGVCGYIQCDCSLQLHPTALYLKYRT